MEHRNLLFASPTTAAWGLSRNGKLVSSLMPEMARWLFNSAQAGDQEMDKNMVWTFEKPSSTNRINLVSNARTRLHEFGSESRASARGTRIFSNRVWRGFGG
jgi:hypothetical protein